MTVTYNSAEKLRRYWGKERPAFVEWIVVDNGSSDDSVVVAESLGATVIALGSNRGFSHANNVGFEHGESDYVAFANPDVTVDWASLGHLAGRIDRVGGIVGPQLVYEDGTLQPNGRGAPSLVNKVLNRLRGERPHERYRIYADVGEEKYVGWLIGAAVAGRRTTFRRIGKPWDDDFFLYYEDSDLGLRAWAKGVPVVVTGDVRWVHGWQRETATLAFGPWKREFASLARFYARYPTLIFTTDPGRGLRPVQGLWGTHYTEVTAS